VIVEELAKCLMEVHGKGFSSSNLLLMRWFYLVCPQKFQTVSGKSQTPQALSTESPILQTPSAILSWSHYYLLLRLDDENKRNFYEIETTENNW
jgi:hypothetical protein